MGILSTFPLILFLMGTGVGSGNPTPSPGDGPGGQETIIPDLNGVSRGEGWKVTNRAATVARENGRTVVSLDARSGDGAVWLQDLEFSSGTIEVSIRGENAPGRSFVGVAFQGLDDTTYDAVYFRPFNFLADNELSRSHMVQYISHPLHTWSRLREERTGEFENRIADPPDPDSFFRVRIEVRPPEIQVYVGGASDPCLVVEQLEGRTGGRIGLWVGNGSSGSFSDLVIRPEG